jgi:cyclin-dependent kinase
LLELLHKYKFDGVDLDIEERYKYNEVTRLIRQLRGDMGPKFLITLAPVYPALLPRHPTLIGLTRRLLNMEAYPAPDPLTAAVCQAKHLNNKRNLSGFSHMALESGPEGAMISWYNLQVYCGWGDPTKNAYDRIIEAGWRPERVVLGVVTNKHNGAGWYSVRQLARVLRGYTEKYSGTDGRAMFGGVMGWEYFNAGMDVEDVAGPWAWVREVGKAMKLVPFGPDPPV